VGAAARTPTIDPPLAGVIAWFEAEGRDLPWRRTRDVYAVWVAEVMSAQTTVGRAAVAWTAWLERWPTVEALAAASLGDVLRQWQGLGYPRRARDLHRSAQTVVSSGWPDDLTALPGVGAYVSAAVRCFALEQPVLPLDVNIRRLLARRFPDGIEIAADPWRAGQALMEFGQRICTASRPRCAECPVAVGCPGPGSDGAVREARRCRSRQPRFQGSLRQRRGRLLREVLSGGGVRLADVDAEAADGLVADGLLRHSQGWLRPPR
jgi:A/G-specific adenine glycosylase